MKLAFLVNTYSPVFNRYLAVQTRELEHLGHSVEQVSIRRGAWPRVEEREDAEIARTFVILEQPRRQLLGEVLRTIVERPRRFAAGLRLALRTGWRSHRGLARHLAYLAEACVVRSRVAARGIEHLHAHTATNSATIAMLTAELGGPPFSFTAHGPFAVRRQSRTELGEKVSRARFVVAVSTFGRRLLEERLEPPLAGRVHVIRLGVDPSFAASPRSDPPTEPRFVSIGRLAREKGHDVLLRAVARLHERGRRIELDLIGDGPLRSELEGRVAQLDLSRRVRLHGWRGSREIRDALTQSRALVLPSLSENLPVVLMESLAMHRPVIASAVGAVGELVEPGVSGWLVPPNNPLLLSQVLDEVASAPREILRQMGAAGAERVTARHDASTQARHLARLFLEEARS